MAKRKRKAPMVAPVQPVFLYKEQLRPSGFPHGATLFRLIQRGEFPEPKHVTPGRKAWLVSDLLRWAESRPTAPNLWRGAKPTSHYRAKAKEAMKVRASPTPARRPRGRPRKAKEVADATP